MSLLAEAGWSPADSQTWSGRPCRQSPSPIPLSQNRAIFRVLWKEGLGRPCHLWAGRVDDGTRGALRTSVGGCEDLDWAHLRDTCLSRVQDCSPGTLSWAPALRLCPSCYRCPESSLPPSLPIPTFTSLPFWFLLSLPASNTLGPRGRVGSLSFVTSLDRVLSL